MYTNVAYEHTLITFRFFLTVPFTDLWDVLGEVNNTAMRKFPSVSKYRRVSGGRRSMVKVVRSRTWDGTPKVLAMCYSQSQREARPFSFSLVSLLVMTGGHSQACHEANHLFPSSEHIIMRACSSEAASVTYAPVGSHCHCAN